MYVFIYLFNTVIGDNNINHQMGRWADGGHIRTGQDENKNKNKTFTNKGGRKER